MAILARRRQQAPPLPDAQDLEAGEIRPVRAVDRAQLQVSRSQPRKVAGEPLAMGHARQPPLVPDQKVDLAERRQGGVDRPRLPGQVGRQGAGTGPGHQVRRLTPEERVGLLRRVAPRIADQDIAVSVVHDIGRSGPAPTAARAVQPVHLGESHQIGACVLDDCAVRRAPGFLEGGAEDVEQAVGLDDAEIVQRLIGIAEDWIAQGLPIQLGRCRPGGEREAEQARGRDATRKAYQL